MSLLELFCSVDDFWMDFAPQWQQTQLDDGRKRQRTGQMHSSEIMTILIHFQQSHYRNFKAYHTEHVQVHLKSEFPRQLSRVLRQLREHASESRNMRLS